MFAVVGVNGVSTVDPSGGKPNAAGLLATIAVTYEDGSNDTIYSDVAWKANKEVDAGFQLPSFDDANWPPAASIGSYGVAPWLLNVSVPEFPVVISTLTSVTQPTSATTTTAMAGLTPTSSDLSASTITASNSSPPNATHIERRRHFQIPQTSYHRRSGRRHSFLPDYSFPCLSIPQVASQCTFLPSYSSQRHE